MVAIKAGRHTMEFEDSIVTQQSISLVKIIWHLRPTTKLRHSKWLTTYLRKVHQAADAYMRERENMARKIHIYRFTFSMKFPVGVGYLFSVLTGTMSSVSTLYESELINTIRMSVVDSAR